MRYFWFLVLIIWTFPTVADPQIDAQAQEAHWIFDPVNTDREHELNQHVGITRLDDGRVNAYVENTFRIPSKVLPAGIPEVNGEPRIDICSNCDPDPAFAQQLSLATCTVVDSGGTAYTSNNWWMVLRVIEDAYGVATLKGSMECDKAQAQ